VEQFMGLQPEATIRALLDRHVPPADATEAPPAIDTTLQQAASGRPEYVAAQALDQRDAAAAATAIETLAADKPDHAALPALRARLAFVEAANAHPDAVALRATLESNPADPAARHALAAHHAVAGDFATALAEWLDLMRRNRSYGEDLARRSLLQAFDVLGEQHELVTLYRRRMASLLH
jgi:putative thioredoxin